MDSDMERDTENMGRSEGRIGLGVLIINIVIIIIMIIIIKKGRREEK